MAVKPSSWPKRESGANRQIGERQIAIMRRAQDSPSGQVVIDPACNADWCAVKRLVQRGLMVRWTFGGKGVGRLTVYSLSERGRLKLQEISSSR